MYSRLLKTMLALVFMASSVNAQEKISNLKFYKVQPGDDLGSILVKVRAKEARRKKLYGKDSLIQKVIALKGNEKIALKNGDLLFPGDIIYFTDEGEVESIQKNESQQNKQEVVSVDQSVASPSKRMELGRFSFDIGGSNFRLTGVVQSNNTKGTLLSDTNLNAVLSWYPEIQDVLRSRIYFGYQSFDLLPETNGRSVVNHANNLSKYGIELYYDFNADWNVMFGYQNAETILYRGLSLTSYEVDRISLADINFGFGYRVWNSERFDLFLNAIYGSYMAKTVSVYDIKEGSKYEFNLSLKPARHLSRGLQAQLYAHHSQLTADVIGNRLKYDKSEVGASVGYFINFSTFEK